MTPLDPETRGAWIAAMTDRLKAARTSTDPMGDEGPPPIHYFPSIPSTNDHLKDLAQAGTPDWTLVLAGEQTGGRGRHGRYWYSPAGGGIYSSILLRPDLIPEAMGWPTLCAALALVRAGRTQGIMLSLKWPNDVLYEGRKVAGVLAEGIAEEGRVRDVVMGAGVNLFWAPDEIPLDLRQKATALNLCGAGELDTDRLLADYLWELRVLLDHLHVHQGMVLEGAAPTLAAEVLARMDHLGESVTVVAGSERITGICTGLTPEGYLQLDGGRSVAAGELIMRLPEDGS